VTGAVKRALDLTLASLALLVLAPLLAALWVAVRCTSPGPAVFRQQRLGRHGRPFTMYKFRTMWTDAGDAAHRTYVRNMLTGAAASNGGLYKLVGDPRITPVGAFLRRTSLDELPQLVNVVHGQMSLVGPRPVLGWEAELFPPAARARFGVRPGLTGLWQISGRNRLTMLQALDLDVEYVHRHTIWLDLAIILKTIPAQLRRGAA
jgi:lipopolysaccharide/colanic/teichoic acid biosynthesis glycosyltransferase